MSSRVRDTWHADPDAYGPRRHRKPCSYEAYVPDLLGPASWELPSDLAADIVDAERELAVFDSRVHEAHDLEQLARFLLRAEAVASSKIEGLQVSGRRLARHAAGHPGRDATADAVLGNVAAMQLAVDEVARAEVVTREHLLQIHTVLMQQTETPQLAGQVRTTQNWIGGNDFNPCQAAFVPPPPNRVLELMDDLCVFINRDDLPGVLQAALTHAQFETIHPFIDGNGRTGRALIHVVFRRRGLATGFVPPVSLALATDTDGYISGLNAFRYDGHPDEPAAKEGVRRWMEVFVTATRRATRDAEALRTSLLELEANWWAALNPRRNSAAAKLLPLFIANPVMSTDDAARLAAVSASAAYAAVEQMVAAGIITPVAGSARNRLFEAKGVFSVLTDYERSSATASGDTRAERPRRAVPYREE
ncbi:MAG TPA: Fic family protein [Kineosporiaceae bacterium]|nr:Fic family protein [Kineosporiaceae bacterium]